MLVVHVGWPAQDSSLPLGLNGSLSPPQAEALHQVKALPGKLRKLLCHEAIGPASADLGPSVSVGSKPCMWTK